MTEETPTPTPDLTLREEMASPPKTKPKREIVKKEQVRIASINLTEAAFQALLAIQKKTGNSRRDIISAAIVDHLAPTLNQTVLRFKFPEPSLLLDLRLEVVEMVSAAEQIRKGLYSVRPTDKEQKETVSKHINKVQKWLTKADEMEVNLQEKQKLLNALTPVDYERIPKVLEWLVGMRDSAKTSTDKKARIERYDIIEKLCNLSI
jgi:lysyl-tRNA synthetase class I